MLAALLWKTIKTFQHLSWRWYSTHFSAKQKNNTFNLLSSSERLSAGERLTRWGLADDRDLFLPLFAFFASFLFYSLTIQDLKDDPGRWNQQTAEVNLRLFHSVISPSFFCHFASIPSCFSVARLQHSSIRFHTLSHACKEHPQGTISKKWMSCLCYSYD